MLWADDGGSIQYPGRSVSAVKFPSLASHSVSNPPIWLGEAALRHAVKSRVAHEWGGWGRLSDDGPGHYNPDLERGPLGRRSNNPPRWCAIESAARHSAGQPL